MNEPALGQDVEEVRLEVCHGMSRVSLYEPGLSELGAVRFAGTCMGRRVSKQEGEIWRALGLMSGTSMDGIDVAVHRNRRDVRPSKRWFTATYPYSEAFRDQLKAGLADAAGLRRPGRAAGAA